MTILYSIKIPHDLKQKLETIESDIETIESDIETKLQKPTDNGSSVTGYYLKATNDNGDNTIWESIVQDKTLVLQQEGATTISGTYPDFTISSTDTTYSAGTGINIDNNNEISIGQSVNTTDNVLFGNYSRIGDPSSLSFATFAHTNFFDNVNAALIQDNVGQTFLMSGSLIETRINGATKMITDGNGIGIGGVSLVGFPLAVTGSIYASGGFNGGNGAASWTGTSFLGNIQPLSNADNTYSIGTASARYTNVFSVNFSTTSDDRLKDNETDISGGLETIMKLKPQTYDFKSSEEPDAKHLGLRSGFIAQDVLEIPELAHAVNVPENETEKVGKEIDENGNIVDSDREATCYLSLDYNTIFTHAVKAIQELNGVVKNQQTVINNLNLRLEALESNSTG